MKKILILVVGLLICNNIFAEEPHGKKVNLDFKVGLNIGGTSPIPLPAEIREIKGFKPNFNGSLETDVNFRLDKNGRWELGTGLRFEKKSMTTDARVKDYSMEIIGKGGEKMAGRWTGDVNTYYSAYNLTLPILGSYKACRNFKVQFGPYISYLFNQEFSGDVSNGYLRQGNPTGEKVVFEGDAKGPYNFSNNLYNFQYGLMAGVNWEFAKHFIVSGHLSWGLRNVFQDDFKTITFNMYPIYFNLGVGYRLFSEKEKKH